VWNQQGTRIKRVPTLLGIKTTTFLVLSRPAHFVPSVLPSAFTSWCMYDLARKGS